MHLDHDHPHDHPHTHDEAHGHCAEHIHCGEHINCADCGHDPRAELLALMRYMDEVRYAEALALYGLRQNVFTDPQKPMKVAPGIYPMNGATPDSPCLTTVDFALTYFLVSGELERSKVPVNLIITDASGMSVLTAWSRSSPPSSAGTASGPAI